MSGRALFLERWAADLVDLSERTSGSIVIDPPHGFTEEEAMAAVGAEIQRRTITNPHPRVCVPSLRATLANVCRYVWQEQRPHLVLLALVALMTCVCLLCAPSGCAPQQVTP